VYFHGRPLVRTQYERFLLELSELLETCIARLPSFGHQRVLDAQVRINPRGDVVVLRFRVLSAKLGNVCKLMVILKYEPSATGAWPKMK
jgi:hypothetical protein